MNLQDIKMIKNIKNKLNNLYVNRKYRKSREDFEKAIKLIIKSNLCFRDAGNFFQSEDISGKAYLENFATIRIKSCRRIGHSISSAKVCSDIYNKVLFLQPTIQMSLRSEREVRREINRKNISFSSYTSRDYVGKRFNCIIADCASFYTDKERRQIEEAALYSIGEKDFTLIWIL